MQHTTIFFTYEKKLTLTIEETVSPRAKRLAKKKRVSVSEMVENYLAEKTASEIGWKPKEDSWTKKMTGILSSEHKQQYREDTIKKLKQEAVGQKYEI